MLRMRTALQAAFPAALLVPLAVSLLGCSGSDDPSTPPQPTAEDTYIRATITAVDTDSPCIPGVVCEPEFFSCDGRQGFTVPSVWTVEATEAMGGATSYTARVPDVPGPGSNARAFIELSGTDTTRDTAVSIGFGLEIDRATGTVYLGFGDPTTTYANIDESCDTINSAFDPVTLFQLNGGAPFDLQLTSLPVANGDLVFARPDGTGLTDSYIEGTFEFVGVNRQELGRTIIGSVNVQGCFRLHLTELASALPVMPDPPAPACN